MSLETFFTEIDSNELASGLNSAGLRQMLAEHGLKIVPRDPTDAMRAIPKQQELTTIGVWRAMWDRAE